MFLFRSLFSICSVKARELFVRDATLIARLSDMPEEIAHSVLHETESGNLQWIDEHILRALNEQTRSVLVRHVVLCHVCPFSGSSVFPVMERLTIISGSVLAVLNMFEPSDPLLSSNKIHKTTHLVLPCTLSSYDHTAAME